MRITRLTLLTRQPRRVVFDVQAVQTDEGTEFMVEFEYSWGNFAHVYVEKTERDGRRITSESRKHELEMFGKLQCQGCPVSFAMRVFVYKLRFKH